MPAQLQKTFEENAAPQTDLPCLVHYLWLDKCEMSALKDKPLCAIPLHYVDRAIENARKYPDTEFQLWADPEFWDDTPTKFLLESHFYASECKNITLRNLNDIEDYRKNPFFTGNKEQRGNIWHRVDMARLLVVEHSLATDPEHVSVYTDFDTSDIKIQNARFKSALDSFGFVLGASVQPEYKAKTYPPRYENSYFAFRNNEQSKNLLPDIIRDAWKRLEREEDVGRSCVYNSYRESIEAYFTRENPGNLSDSLMDVIWPMGYCIPVNFEYQDICRPVSAYI